MITFIESTDGIEASQLQGFFADWPAAPSPEEHLRLLRQSDLAILAIDDLSGRVVGFVTAITDGVLSACIPLLEVLPSHRGGGIGSQLMRRMLAQLSGLYMIDLTCDPGRQTFYSRFGMEPSTGMMLRHRGNQAGRKP